MQSAPQEPVAISPPVNVDHMEHRVDPAPESVTLQSTVWGTLRTVQWTPITEMALAAIITMTTVLRGRARHTTHNAGFTLVSLIHISMYCVWLWGQYCPSS